MEITPDTAITIGLVVQYIALGLYAAYRQITKSKRQVREEQRQSALLERARNEALLQMQARMDESTAQHQKAYQVAQQHRNELMQQIQQLTQQVARLRGELELSDKARMQLENRLQDVNEGIRDTRTELKSAKNEIDGLRINNVHLSAVNEQLVLHSSQLEKMIEPVMNLVRSWAEQQGKSAA